MKKALVFVTAFALVLVAGAAVALIGTPGGDTDNPAAVEKPTTTESKDHEDPVDVSEPDDAPLEEHVKAESEQSNQDKSGKEKEVGDSDAEESDKPEQSKDTRPPELQILHPEDGQHFETREVVFEGKTEPGARVYAGKYEADVDEVGNWRIVLILTNDGWNKATLTAKDGAGNESTASVKAYYETSKDEDPEEDKPKDKESKDYEFSANQKFGTCSEEPPYDVWYGTGQPGTKVWIVSDYGEGSTTVSEKGKWHLKVKFYEAPCNEKIDVVLETDAGHRKVYDFKRICEEGGGEQDK